MKRRLNILCLACTELLGIGAGVLYLSGSQDGGADRTGAGKERE